MLCRVGRETERAFVVTMLELGGDGSHCEDHAEQANCDERHLEGASHLDSVSWAEATSINPRVLPVDGSTVDIAENKSSTGTQVGGYL